ncbi:glycosyltransferase family 25 protein [Roseinatronobacter thiooxidans]|nr:glycosyltransferase family 25 protein [Roseinatronobacter thiooxidans]
MSGKIPVYYINLDSSEDRRGSIEAGLRKAGVTNATRVSAFDGRGVDLTQTTDCDLRAAHRFLGRPLRGAEYGCYRSHLDCIERFLATDSPYGIVLEDDAAIDDDFLQVIAASIDIMEKTKRHWDLIHLGAGRLKIYSRLEPLGGGHDLVKAHYFPMMTTALLWSRQGAQNILDHHRTITMPVDTQFREIMVKRDLGFAIWPAITRQIGMSSDIDGDGATRKAHGRSWYYGFAKQERLWRNKIIAFYHKLTLRR